MRSSFFATIAISCLMIACPSSPIPDTGTTDPSYDCRIGAYQCAEGFSCEPIGSGEFTCIRSSIMPPTGGSEVPGGTYVSGTEMSSGVMYSGTTAGEYNEPDDCRTFGCSYDEVCTLDDYGDYSCLELSQCSNNNGGCGDPDYILCIDEYGGSFSCVDIEECAYDNGGCGDPNRYFCVERDGAPPLCNEISYAEAPPFLGAFSEVFVLQGSSDIENCHVVYMPTDYGLADTDGGCESCSYAWNITYNLVHNSCGSDGAQRSFEMPLGVDMINRQVMLKVNGTWGQFGGTGTLASVSSKSASLIVFERNPFGPTSGQYGDVYARTQFIGLTWEKESVSCGDSYCDYGDFSCSEDCLSGQTPATGYRFRTFGFSPDRGDYQHCFIVTHLSARNLEPSSGCSNCSEAWYFSEKYLLSNCGPWANPVGTTKRNDIGSRNRNQMVFYHSSREEWMNVTTQYSEYRSEYNSLISSWDGLDYQDIDSDGRRDSNEPSRSRSQLIVIHHQ